MPRSKKNKPLKISSRKSNLCACVGGLPSPLSMFAIHSAASIVNKVQGHCRVIPFNQGLNHELSSADDPTVLFFDVPDQAAVRVLMEIDHSIPLIVVQDDVQKTLEYCMIARNMTEVEAARFVSQSIACLSVVADSGSAILLQGGESDDIAAWFDQIASAMRVESEFWNQARADVLSAYSGLPLLGDAVDHHIHLAREAKLARQSSTVIGSLVATLTVSSSEMRTWPRDLLLDARPPYPAVSESIDLTGPSRVLTFGPYMHLPPGCWIARYRFVSERNESSNLLVFDVVADGYVQDSVYVRCAESGQFGVDLHFSVERPELPIEIRCFTGEGAIDGLIDPLGIDLWREESRTFDVEHG